MRVQEAANILGLGSKLNRLDTSLTEELINKAFRKKARVCHPDTGGDDASFRRLTEARQVMLGYVNNGSPGKSSHSDIFARVFRQRARQRRPNRQTKPIIVKVDLADVYHRRIIETKLRVTKPCPTCKCCGRTGNDCPHCHGTGYVSNGGNNFFKSLCADCLGTGLDTICTTCNGVGFTETLEDAKIKLNERIYTDHVLRFDTGDFITIHVNIPDGYKVTQDNTIVYTEYVNLLHALRGYKIDILGREFRIPPRLFGELKLDEDLVYQQNIKRDDPIFNEILEKYEQTERAD